MRDPAVPDLRNCAARAIRLVLSIAIGIIVTGVAIVAAETQHITIRGTVWSFLALATAAVTALALATHALLGRLAPRLRSRRAPLPRAWLIRR